MTKKEIAKVIISVLIAALTALAAGLGLTSCNVTRTITTRSEAWQKGDTSVIIQSKTVESYDGSRKWTPSIFEIIYNQKSASLPKTKLPSDECNECYTPQAFLRVECNETLFCKRSEFFVKRTDNYWVVRNVYWVLDSGSLLTRDQEPISIRPQGSTAAFLVT